MKEIENRTNLFPIKAKVMEFEIPDNDPFKNDKLDRKNYAKALTDMVDLYMEGAVIALNGGWGTGKTTFVKMWGQYMYNQGFPVIYYNAWEDDISEEPLFSLLRGLKSIEKKKDDEKKLHKVFTAGGKILAGLATGAAKGLLGKAGEIVAEAGKGALDAMADEFTSSLEKEDETEVVLSRFKEVLIEYVAFVCDNGKPLVYLIDELDRCNPTFAVKVMERMKHLFDVPNVVFVLSVDKQQLAYSINGFYGSENIDSFEYLRRFVDIEYNLPEPDPEKFCDYLYDYFGFCEFVESESRKIVSGGYKVLEDKSIFLEIAKLIVKHKHLSLRQTERIFSLARIGLCEMSNKSKLFTEVYFFLAFLKVCEPSVFSKIRDFDYGQQELLEAIEGLGADIIRMEDLQGTNYYIYCVCHLMLCYEESLRDIPKKHKPIAVKGDNSMSLNFKIFDNQRGNELLSHFNQRFDLVVDIRHFTMKLELLMPIQDS